MNKILDFLKYQECPSINGIIFPNEKINPIRLNVNWGPPIKYEIEKLRETSLKEIEIKGELFWNDCSILCEYEYDLMNIKAIGGEGDYGSDGFVAVINLLTDELMWIAFFELSNPFNKIKIEEGFVLAYSTLNCLWRFPLSSPIEFCVSAL